MYQTNSGHQPKTDRNNKCKICLINSKIVIEFKKANFKNSLEFIILIYTVLVNGL